METFLKIIHTTFLNVAKIYSKKMIRRKGRGEKKCIAKVRREDIPTLG